MNLYAIRDRRTGLYSMGGARVWWNERGKRWTLLSHVKLHLSALRGYSVAYSQDVELVTFEQVEVASKPLREL